MDVNSAIFILFTEHLSTLRFGDTSAEKKVLVNDVVKGSSKLLLIKSVRHETLLREMTHPVDPIEARCEKGKTDCGKSRRHNNLLSSTIISIVKRVRYSCSLAQQERNAAEKSEKINVGV